MRLPLRTRFAVDPAGTRWRVSIRWLPWTPRSRGPDVGTFDILDASAFGDELGVGCVVALVVGAIVLVLPLALFLLELFVFAFVFVVVVLGMGALGLRRWTVEVEGVAVRDADDIAQPTVVRRSLARHRGIAAADLAIQATATAIERGEFDPADQSR